MPRRMFSTNSHSRSRNSGAASSKVHTVKDPPSLDRVYVQCIDFKSVGLPEYRDTYAIVIDNLFTEEDCRKLFSITAGSFDNFSGNWVEAEIDAGGGKQYLDTTFRKSSRIMVDDHSTASWIFEKLHPYLRDIQHCTFDGLQFRPSTEKPKSEDKLTAKLLRLNERLRFLKYEPGSFFKVILA